MKKLLYLSLFILTFSCSSDDDGTTIDTSQLVGEWTLNNIEISKITIEGTDMTDLYLSMLEDEDTDELFGEFEESVFDFNANNTLTVSSDGGELIPYTINNDMLTIDELTFDIIKLDASKMILEIDFMSMMEDAFDGMDDDETENPFDDMEMLTQWHFSKN